MRKTVIVGLLALVLESCGPSPNPGSNSEKSTIQPSVAAVEAPEELLRHRNNGIMDASVQFATNLTIMNSYGARMRCGDLYKVEGISLRDTLPTDHGIIADTRYSLTKLQEDPSYIGRQCFGIDLRYGDVPAIGSMLQGAKRYELAEWDSGWRVTRPFDE